MELSLDLPRSTVCKNFFFSVFIEYFNINGVHIYGVAVAKRTEVTAESKIHKKN